LNESRTEAEARFEARRRRAGQILAPLAFVGMLALPMPGLTPQGHGLAAITAMTVILWITEAIPLAAAAVLAPSLAVVSGRHRCDHRVRAAGEPADLPVHGRLHAGARAGRAGPRSPGRAVAARSAVDLRLARPRERGDRRGRRI
jgi:hypothetical protein